MKLERHHKVSQTPSALSSIQAPGAENSDINFEEERPNIRPDETTSSSCLCYSHRRLSLFDLTQLKWPESRPSFGLN